MFYLISILLGIVAGKMFTFQMILTLTIIDMIVNLYFFVKRPGELGGFIIASFAFVAIVGCASMWVTYYITTNQSWLGNFINSYIFR